jgi:hypothetical protein
MVRKIVVLFMALFSIILIASFASASCTWSLDNCSAGGAVVGIRPAPNPEGYYGSVWGTKDVYWPTNQYISSMYGTYVYCCPGFSGVGGEVEHTPSQLDTDTPITSCKYSYEGVLPTNRYIWRVELNKLAGINYGHMCSDSSGNGDEPGSVGVSKLNGLNLYCVSTGGVVGTCRELQMWQDTDPTYSNDVKCSDHEIVTSVKPYKTEACRGNAFGYSDDDTIGGGSDYGYLWPISWLNGYVITCCEANNAVFSSQSIPTTMSAGATYSISVTMNNAGVRDWFESIPHSQLSDSFRLGVLQGVNPPDPSDWRWGMNRIYIPANTYVHPGESHTFTATVTAPSTPGTYTIEFQMLQEGVEWFGDISSVTISVGPAAGTAGQIKNFSEDDNDAVSDGQSWHSCNANGDESTFGTIQMQNNEILNISTSANSEKHGYLCYQGQFHDLGIVQNPGFQTAGTGGLSDAANWAESTKMQRSNSQTVKSWVMGKYYAAANGQLETSVSDWINVLPNKKYRLNGVIAYITGAATNSYIDVHNGIDQSCRTDNCAFTDCHAYANSGTYSASPTYCDFQTGMNTNQISLRVVSDVGAAAEFDSISISSAHESIAECCGDSLSNCYSSASGDGVRDITGQKVGDYVCREDKQWQLCATPTTEICDGIDNDCDGKIDENFVCDTTFPKVNFNDVSKLGDLELGEKPAGYFWGYASWGWYCTPLASELAACQNKFPGSTQFIKRADSVTRVGCISGMSPGGTDYGWPYSYYDCLKSYPAAESWQKSDFIVNYNATDETGLASCNLSIKDGAAAWVNKGNISCGVNQQLTISVGAGKNCTALGFDSCGVKIIATDIAKYVNDTTIRYFSIDYTPPTTTASATSGGAAYTFGVLTNNDVDVTLTCVNEAPCDKTLYCTDTANTCAPSLTYTSPVRISTEGTSYIRYNSSDILGQIGTVQSSMIKIAKTRPSASVAINNNAVYVTSTGVSLSLTYSDTGGPGIPALGCRYSNSVPAAESWEACAAAKSWTLTSGDGVKTVYYQVRDTAGNLNQTTDTIILDTIFPTTTVSYPATKTVTLVCNDANGCTGKYKVANFSGAGSTCPATYSGLVYNYAANILPVCGTGSCKVCYASNDSAGNIETIKSSNEIRTDDTPPTVTFTPDGHDWTTQNVSFTITCQDLESGCKSIQYLFLSYNFSSGAYYPTTTPITVSGSSVRDSWNCTTGKTCRAKLSVRPVDNLDNGNTYYSNDFEIDLQAPSIESVSCTYRKSASNPKYSCTADPGYVTINLPVNLSAIANDTGVGVTNISIYLTNDSGRVTVINTNLNNFPRKSESKLIPSLAPVTYSYKAIATDYLGNSASYPEQSFRIGGDSSKTCGDNGGDICRDYQVCGAVTWPAKDTNECCVPSGNCINRSSLATCSAQKGVIYDEDLYSCPPGFTIPAADTVEKNKCCKTTVTAKQQSVNWYDLIGNKLSGAAKGDRVKCIGISKDEGLYNITITLGNTIINKTTKIFVNSTLRAIVGPLELTETGTYKCEGIFY